jgi:eukaryotic-like serine/threonine-protein kinase
VSATLLVVDDYPANRELLARRLERAGYGIEIAASGKEALDILGRASVDLVLLDIMMPEMSGLEVLTRIREKHSASDLPVVMVTARTESADVVEALGLGANDYVTKPIDFPVVLARIEAHLRTRTEAAVAAAAPAASSSASGEVQPGSVLDGRYRIDARIGGGGFGAVFRGRHLDLDQPVAVKVLALRGGADPSALDRFRREGISACRVRHPHAVSVVDFGVTEAGVAFLVMELLEGRTLERELDESGALTPARATFVLAPVCGAVAEAHRSGVLHRDIKPANIFLHRRAGAEVPKILDFGVAKLAGEAAFARSLTLDSSLLGTPAYMAPERFHYEPYGPASDVYSLGMTLYHALAGRLPFDSGGDDPLAVVASHAGEPPPPLRSSNRAVGDALESAVIDALSRDPKGRPTAEELERRLREAT